MQDSFSKFSLVGGRLIYDYQNQTNKSWGFPILVEERSKTAQYRVKTALENYGK